VGDLLQPRHVGTWPEVRDQLNRILRGWSTYFNHGSRKAAYRAIDNHVYQGVLDFLRRRSKVESRGTTRFTYKAVYGELGVLRLRRVHLGRFRELTVKSVRKPDAGNRHVRFDERG
jgi:RNA-directed DNA polymerase